MAMLPAFLTRSIDRLTPEGAVEPTGLAMVSLGAPPMLISRERCRFELMRTPETVKGSALTAAARIHAQTHAPYQDPGWLVTRKGRALGIWWWDAEWVAEALARHRIAANTEILPEAMMQPEGEGWRIVPGGSGYEAQVWDGGFLVASTWRRRPFDGRDWDAFVRVQQDVSLEPPAKPPSAQPLPYTLRSDYRRRTLSTRGLEALAPLALTTGVAVILGATALLVGQGLRLGAESRQVERQIEAAKAAPHDSLRPALTVEAQRLQRIRAATDGPDPLVLVESAQKILAPFHLKVSGFTATRQEVTIVVAVEAVAGIDLITEELENSPHFANIRPTLDRQKRQLTLRMAVRG